MPSYAFFLDIDGTLIDGEYVPPENIEAIAYARRIGVPVFLNTGRGLRFIPDRVWDNFTFDGIVAGSGAYVSVGNRVLQNAAIDSATLIEDFRFLMERGVRFVFEGENQVLVANQSPRHDYWLPLTDEAQLTCEYKNARVEKINLAGQVSPEVNAYLSTHYHLLQHEHYAEASLIGCDKGKGMMLAMTNLPKGTLSVAIGDSMNDREMLEVADISIAMGNAPDNVKALCRSVTLPVREGGVAHAIYSLIGSPDRKEN